MNNKINHLQERCLLLMFSDKTSSFQKILETDRSVTINIRKRQILATEIFKVTLHQTFLGKLSGNKVFNITCSKWEKYSNISAFKKVIKK